jgi:hypothetical protein
MTKKYLLNRYGGFDKFVTKVWLSNLMIGNLSVRYVHTITIHFAMEMKLEHLGKANTT